MVSPETRIPGGVSPLIEGADARCPPALALPDQADELGGAGLAVGAGDSHDRRLTGVEACRYVGEALAGIGSLQHRDLG